MHRADDANGHIDADVDAHNDTADQLVHGVGEADTLAYTGADHDEDADMANRTVYDCSRAGAASTHSEADYHDVVADVTAHHDANDHDSANTHTTDHAYDNAHSAGAEVVNPNDMDALADRDEADQTSDSPLADSDDIHVPFLASPPFKIGDFGDI